MPEVRSDEESLWVPLTIVGALTIAGLGLWKLYELIDEYVGWIELSIYAILVVFGLILLKLIIGFYRDSRKK